MVFLFVSATMLTVVTLFSAAFIILSLIIIAKNERGIQLFLWMTGVVLLPILGSILYFINYLSRGNSWESALKS
jgi:hypothetical protein